MTSLLEQAGAALYGERWQTDIARALGVNDRTVRRWASGQNPLPPTVAHELAELCAARRVELASVRWLLRQAALGGP